MRSVPICAGCGIYPACVKSSRPHLCFQCGNGAKENKRRQDARAKAILDALKKSPPPAG